MAVYVEVRNTGNTKWINRDYNVPVTNFVKVFYITYVLTEINFLLCKISILVFISLSLSLPLSDQPLNVLFSKKYL